jgi:hypothetical protein
MISKNDFYKKLLFQNKSEQSTVLLLDLRFDAKNIKIGFIINTTLLWMHNECIYKAKINLSKVFDFGFCRRQNPKRSIADLLGRESSKNTNYEKKS